MTRPTLDAGSDEIRSWRTSGDIMDVPFADLPFTLESFASRHYQEAMAMYTEVCDAHPDTDYEDYACVYADHFLADGGNWALGLMIQRHDESRDLIEKGEAIEHCTLSTFLEIFNDELIYHLNLSDIYVMVPMERALDALLLDAFRVKRAKRVISDAIVHWACRPGGMTYLDIEAHWG